MTNFFQIISAKITAFVSVVIITATSILPWSATDTNGVVDTSTVSPSAIVSESSPLSVPDAKTEIEVDPTPLPEIDEPIPEKELQIRVVQKPVEDSAIVTPTPSPTIQPKEYSIIPISVMNIKSMESDLQVIAQNAYQEFLRTSNLNRLDESNQMEILATIYSRMLKEEIANAQQNLSQIKQENNNTPPPAVVFQPDPKIVAKLDELRQTIVRIQDAPVPMNVIEGRKQRAYQDWMQNNIEVYSVISQNGYYSNILNSILSAYGL